MPQRAIPAFGDWESKAQTYTAIFDNARAGKGSGNMINPNDPEFFSILRDQHAKPFRADDEKAEHPEKQQTPLPTPVSKRVNKRKDNVNPDASPRSLNAELRDGATCAEILSQTNDTGDEDTDSSDSGYSAESAGSHVTTSKRNRMPPRIDQTRSALPDANRSELKRGLDRGLKETAKAREQRTLGTKHPVVPPFGAWDDRNSAEDYSAIFSDVRESRKTGASTLYSGTRPTEAQNARHVRASREKAGWRMYLCGSRSASYVIEPQNR